MNPIAISAIEGICAATVGTAKLIWTKKEEKLNLVNEYFPL